MGTHWRFIWTYYINNGMFTHEKKMPMVKCEYNMDIHVSDTYDML